MSEVGTCKWRLYTVSGEFVTEERYPADKAKNRFNDGDQRAVEVEGGGYVKTSHIVAYKPYVESRPHTIVGLG